MTERRNLSNLLTTATLNTTPQSTNTKVVVVMD